MYVGNEYVRRDSVCKEGMKRRFGIVNFWAVVLGWLVGVEWWACCWLERGGEGREGREGRSRGYCLGWG